MSALPRPVWVSLPIEGDGDPRNRIWDGDSYIVELADGEQLWASFTRDGGFVACDDEGNEIARPGFSCPMPLDNVARVMVRGHVAGFGPNCPKAGEPLKIGLVVVQPSLTDRVVAELLARVPAAMARAKQIIERGHDEPVTSSDRDTRHQESA